MGFGDKVGNAARKLAGKAKEATGTAIGDDRLKAEGKRDQARADLRQAVEKVKDAFRKR
ncbi:CsbD family protein [Arthrobacter sp. B0490]|uniref:CsbD family protein n=1 Tax=Arthrobacter sp. B0490 TaxID=2058891 RepID=UPI000CE331CA|nr:CsbD family protein [Arthrobacter sp. B0490]